MSWERRGYGGGAVATTLASGINNSDASLSVAAATGYPSAPFFIVVDAGESTEEKILVGAKSGTTFSSLTRGVDGTTAQTHGSGASVRHCYTATDADEANQVTSAMTTRGDLIRRGSSGPERLAVGTTGQAVYYDGTDTKFGAIPAAGIATDAVTSAKIQDSAVTLAKIADNTITHAKLSTGYRLHYIGTSAPSSPSEGDLWSETDTDRLKVYTGSAWQTIGWLTSSGRIGWSLETSTTMTTPSLENVTWVTENTDTDSFWSSGSTVTIPSGLGGIYAGYTRIVGSGLTRVQLLHGSNPFDLAMPSSSAAFNSNGALLMIPPVDTPEGTAMGIRVSASTSVTFAKFEMWRVGA